VQSAAHSSVYTAVCTHARTWPSSSNHESSNCALLAEVAAAARCFASAGSTDSASFTAQYAVLLRCKHGAVLVAALTVIITSQYKCWCQQKAECMAMCDHADWFSLHRYRSAMR
jgi:hypothetical protein